MCLPQSLYILSVESFVADTLFMMSDYSIFILFSLALGVRSENHL